MYKLNDCVRLNYTLSTEVLLLCFQTERCNESRFSLFANYTLHVSLQVHRYERWDGDEGQIYRQEFTYIGC